jgi:Mrp family chromosome partitioning ATPase
MNLVRQAGINTSAVDALIQQQSLLINERAALASRRTQIEIDRELASTGIVVFSPAAFARPAEGLGPLQLGILGLIVGVGLGTLLVYFQSSRRMRFATKEQPELVLRAPLFAAVPDFSYESITTVLPVRDSPRTRAAESFRFFAASVDVATEGDSRVIALVAPTIGAGKSTVAANGALAAAMDGSRVLLIDGDFGNQAVSSILVANRVGRPGLTEVISSKASIEEVVQPIRVNNGELYLLSRGSDLVVAADFFRTPAAASFFETVGEAFDLVIVDTPPLLQVAYSSTLLRYIRTALVVVNHDSEVRHLEELEGRLRLLRARILGYVYNRAPLDEALRGYEGSMKDVVGDQSFVDTRLGRR